MGSNQAEIPSEQWQGSDIPLDVQAMSQGALSGALDWPSDPLQMPDSSGPYQMLPWGDLPIPPEFHLNPNLALPSNSPTTDPLVWPPFDLADFGGSISHVSSHGTASSGASTLFDSLPSLTNTTFMGQNAVVPTQFEPLDLSNTSDAWNTAFNNNVFSDGLATIGSHASPTSPSVNYSRELSLDSLSPPSTVTSPGSNLEKIKSASPYDEPENRFVTDDERWQATVNRLRAADRYFLCGVKTTKIFCRPSCASRRAGRQHVQFFSFPNAIQAARDAGFRSCKRCSPDQIGVIDKGSRGVVKALIAIIRDAFEPKHNKSSTCGLKLEDLAKAADLSPFHFQRVFKAATQITPGDFSTACKSLSLQDALAKQLCTCFDFPVAMSADTMCSACKIMEQCSRWTDRTAKKALGGVKPSEYANGLPNSTVQYVTVPAPPGQAYVTFSGPGNVHSVLIGGDALPKTQLRFVNLQQNFTFAAKLQKSIQDLHEESKDRDSEIPDKQLHTLWRGRIWLMIVRDRLLEE